MSIELNATTSKVHSVTVFQADRAEVTRLFDVELKAGQNEVNISQLPTVLDEDSIRVDGIGHNAIISDVIYHPPQSNTAQDEAHKAALKELQKSKTALEQQLSIYKKQGSILQAYSGTLKGADTTGEKLSEFLDIYATRQGGVDAKCTELGEKIAEVDEEIKKENENHRLGGEEDGEAKISITYLVSNASWTPLYDLRANIKKEKTNISLQYRATIVQSTGEDWKEVELTLSTASPQLGSTIPKLSPQWINPIYQYRGMAKSKSKRMPSFGGVPGGALPALSAPLSQSALMSVDEESRGGSGGISGFRVADAQAVEGAISTSYIIDGLSTIPSDTDSSSQAHKVTVAVVDLYADLEWISVPKEVPSAFLQAKIRNTTSYLFLPGRANIFLDDNFVAKSEIEHVSPNETFNISLGVDPQVKVTYHPRTKKTKSHGGLLSTKTITTAFLQKITIKNTRGTVLKKIIIRDQVPVSSDQRLKVSLIEPSGIEFAGRNTIASGASSSEKISIPKEQQIARGVSVRWKFAEDVDVGDGKSDSGLAADGAREGILEWIAEVGAGQSVDLSLAWDVQAPAGLNWGPQ